jgi:hypothetical protein
MVKLLSGKNMSFANRAGVDSMTSSFSAHPGPFNKIKALENHIELSIGFIF